MNNNILLFGKIAGRSFLGWLKVLVTGGLISIPCLITAIVLIGNNEGAGFAGSRAGFVGAVVGLLLLFVEEFWTALLFFGSLAALFAYMSMASGYGIKTAIYLSWKERLGDLMVAKVDAYLERIFARKTPAAKTVTLPEDATLLKKELLQVVKQDKTAPKIQRKMLQYLLKRLNLDNIDFSAPPAQIRMSILQQLRDMISDKIRPSMKTVWMIAAGQVIVLVLAIIFDHH